MNPSASQDHPDVLSEDEESALCLVRQVVAEARLNATTADITAVRKALIGAGASGEPDGPGRNPVIFRFRGASFSLLAQPHPGTGIAVNFEPGKH